MSLTHATCVSCGAMLETTVDACRRCGVAIPPASHPLFGVVVRTAHHEAVDSEEDVVVTARDFMILEELARLRLPRGSAASCGLLEKLKRCQVVLPAEVAADVVTLDSRVVFSVDGGAEEQRVLVHPDGHTLLGWSLPITTPRGLAMLGRRAGSTVLAERPDGRAERINMVCLAYQPEEEARRRRAVAGVATSTLSELLRRPAGLVNAGGPSHDNDDLPPAA